MAVISGTLAEIAEQVNDLNIKVALLVAFDEATGKFFVVSGDSTTGKINVDAT